MSINHIQTELKQNNNDFLIKPHNKFYIRSSAKKRILIGSSLFSFSSFLIQFSLSTYKNYTSSFIFKSTKSFSLLSLAFFSLNEAFYSFFEFQSIYSNYWICYSLSGYICHCFFYKYLIRTSSLYSQWYVALLLSQKVNLIFVVLALMIESILEFVKEVLIYDEVDIVDKYLSIYENMSMSNSMNSKQIEIELKKEISDTNVIFFNSKEKREMLTRYMKNRSEKYKHKNTYNMYEFLEDYRIRKEKEGGFRKDMKEM